MGVGQLLGDHRPHQRLIILRRGEQSGRAQPPGQLGRGRARTLATSPSSAEDCPEGSMVVMSLAPSPDRRRCRRIRPDRPQHHATRVRLRVARPPVGWIWAATAP